MKSLILILFVLIAACTPSPTSTTAPASSTPRPATATPRPATVTPPSAATDSPIPFDDGVSPIRVGQGFGARKGFWEVYFTDPTGSRDETTYIDGVDAALAAAIGSAQRTLDIAAFEFNNPALTQAVLNAHQRGVRVRIVTDDEHGIEDEESTLDQLIDAGVQVVDDDRSALMHNKFMIIDGTTVWTGAWNYTINGTYRNNNNAIAIRSQQAVQAYQTEFDEMFVSRQFGPRSPINTRLTPFTQDGTTVEIWFAPETDVERLLLQKINSAQSSIRFMAFSFTLDDVAAALIDQAQEGVTVQGIFERTGSETQFSEMTPLLCAGVPVRQDGNPFVMHHKVFIIDEQTVLTGSFNFSASATESNDENMLVITDRDLAAQYIQEFNRRWAEASTPDDIACN